MIRGGAAGAALGRSLAQEPIVALIVLAVLATVAWWWWSHNMT